MGDGGMMDSEVHDNMLTKRQQQAIITMQDKGHMWPSSTARRRSASVPALRFRTRRRSPPPINNAISLGFLLRKLHRLNLTFKIGERSYRLTAQSYGGQTLYSFKDLT